MNDAEFAELIQRERCSRALGWKRNDYTCRLCLAEGKTEMNSTFLDWPLYLAGGDPLCDAHGKALMQRCSA